MQLDKLIAGLELLVVPGDGTGVTTPANAGVNLAGVRITDITEDSRTVMPGSLFVARQGERSDGRAYAIEALRAGAAAVLCQAPVPTALLEAARGTGGAGSSSAGVVLTCADVALALARLGERFYGKPSRAMSVVGVTGTNGKTTVTWLVHQILNGVGRGHAGHPDHPPGEHDPSVPEPMRCGLMGTVMVDDGTELAPASLTTAPALEVSRTLARMLESGCRAAALEASSHALDQKRVGAPGGVRFKVAVFTNLTHDHLDYHGTMERYAAAKAVLFEGLAPDACAVVNADDEASERMVRDCKARVVRCSMRSRRSAASPAPEWHARIVASTLAGTECEVVGPWAAGSGGASAMRGGEAKRVRLPLVGAYNVMNALQAFAVAYELGLSSEQIVAALERCAAPPGRMERVTGWDDELAVYVDYAHTDDALERMLGVLRGVLDERNATAASGARRGRLIVVFGCGGDRDRSKRPKMGAAAARLGDRVIITSDNPRTEEPRAIAEQIVAGVGVEWRAKVGVELDRARAIAQAIGEAQSGDVVLIAGKGHEDYQIMPDGQGGTVRRHFDDREQARAALAVRARPGSRVEVRAEVRAEGVTERTREHRA
jgi:UDP-N-acetylmuramoyl-L-alanyl-D-glutamate--2,6-diaminopimelate ligase